MSAVWPHLPALQVVIPLIGALLAGFLRSGRIAFALALLVSWIMPFIADCDAVAGAVLRADLVSPRRLGAAMGHRVSRRCIERVRARPGIRGRRRDHAVCAPLNRVRDRRLAGGVVLLHVSALPDRIARHRDHGRCLQRVRVSRDFLALDLCADRARFGPPRPDRGVSVSDHGDDRRDLLRDRRRPALSPHRHAQHGGYGGAARATLGRASRRPSWRRLHS